MTMADISSDCGFLLHSRPYRDSSLIGEFFLQHSGRLSILFRGVRRAGKTGSKGRILQPFTFLALTYSGRNELKVGQQVEPVAHHFLTGTQLYSGLYLNELLMRLLHREESCPPLFEYYQDALQHLQSNPLEPVLRRFEQQLLAELGYELVLETDVQGNAVDVNKTYLFQPDQGFSLVSAAMRHGQSLDQHCFRGGHLLAIAAHEYEDSEVLQAAKRLCRQALQPHLGDKPLHSRELFKQSRPS